jgi:hypothetical protein
MFVQVHTMRPKLLIFQSISFRLFVTVMSSTRGEPI